MRPKEEFWFWRELVFSNLSRVIRIAIVLLVADVGLLVADIVRRVRGPVGAGYQELFIAHVVLLALVLVFLLVSYLGRPVSAEAVREWHAVLMVTFAVFMLLFCTATALIDQLINGQITMYVIGCMCFAVAVYLPLQVAVPVYVGNHAAFVLGVTLLQNDTQTLMSHYVNGTVVVLLAGVIIKLMFDAQRRVYQGISVIQDQQARLERMAIEDGLTGLFNRRYADARLQEEFERSRRYHRPFSVAMADIDRFKSVNDRFSHQTGDEVLRQLAEMLRAGIRAVDVVARYGGEEFVIMFPETNEEVAFAVCEKIRSTVQNHNWHSIADELTVTISMGVCGTSLAADYEALLRTADQRLYAAKDAGRNRVMSGRREDRE